MEQVEPAMGLGCQLGAAKGGARSDQQRTAVTMFAEMAHRAPAAFVEVSHELADAPPLRGFATSLTKTSTARRYVARRSIRSPKVKSHA